MKKYKVWVLAGEERVKELIVEGFANAEAKCVELFREYISDYTDTEIHVQDKDSWWFDDDEYVYTMDVCGDVCFRKAAYTPDHSCYLYSRLLTDEEKEILEELRNKPDLHVKDLGEYELGVLWSEISPGSIYYADYRNSFDIDEKEVCDYCDNFLETCEQEEDVTAQGFVDYIMCNY